MTTVSPRPASAQASAQSSAQVTAQSPTQAPLPAAPCVSALCGPATAALLGYPFPASFADRLRAEQGWSAAHTDQVLDEYRRFVHLAAYGGRSVTPSQAVDEAWHLHLTYTRDYWERLTPLLPAPLHHEPASGGAGDHSHYRQQYTGTLDLYRQMYGECAPGDIWPDPRVMQPAGSPPQRTLGLALGRILVGLMVSAFVSAFAAIALPLLTALLLGSFTFMLIQVLPLGLVSALDLDWDASTDADGRDGSSDGGSSDSGSDSGSSCGSSCGGGCGS